MPEAQPLADALARVGDRWTLLIVAALLDGPARFGDLVERVTGIAPNILSQRLKRLEADGLVVSRPYSERPVRLEYRLTGSSGELAGALRLLTDWGARRSGRAEAARHRWCGTPLETRWFCPTCDRVVEGEETSDLYYA
jgi:DNA-binding HxlR family transcriptional regulator